MCQNEIGQCAENMDIGLASIINTIRTMVLQRMRAFTLDSNNYGIPFSICKFDTTIFVTCDC